MFYKYCNEGVYKMISIKGYAKKIVGKFYDQIGYFNRLIDLKILEKYSNEINTVLTRYNKKSSDKTMAIRGVRKTNYEITNRKTHQEDVENIVAQISKGLGLNTEIAKIMAKHHDIGHTFYGHTGERWLTGILQDYGLGYILHNATGASELVYTNKVYDQIIEKIKVYNPNISDKKLEQVRKRLWLIIDGINAHNGEILPDEYVANPRKKEKDFLQEMLDCYTKKGVDKKIIPATTEANLTKLVDQISYIPSDLVDGLNAKMIRDENGNLITQIDSEYRAILIQAGIPNELIDECNEKRTYGDVAEKLKEVFIKDLIANSTKKKISMSKEAIELMIKLRDINYRRCTQGSSLNEDEQIYPTAIRILIGRYKEIIDKNGLIEKIKTQDKSINEVITAYEGTVDENFVKYICNTNIENFEFMQQIAENATKDSISSELEIAKDCVLARKEYKLKQELGNKYSMKNGRIQEYMLYYQKKLESGEMIGYESPETEKEIFSNIQSGVSTNNCMNMKDRIAVLMAVRYISTLSDHEFLQTLVDTELVTHEQRKSLTRPYGIIDRRIEGYRRQNNQLQQELRERTEK